jgi:hypothetical protein
MQKKFKHRKTGETATYQDGILKSSGFCVELGVEPSSQFWEEVIEKNYEILSFKLGARIDTLRENGLYGISTGHDKHKTGIYSVNSYINWDIQSVKRLSDGEIFTIGDVCCPNGYIDNDHPITKFELILNNTRLRVNSKNWYLGINDIIKSKPILFTTEDGVDRIKGDEIHFVDCYFKYQGKYIACENTLKLFPNRRIFSTKEAAENYIICNKPCLSLNDVASIYPGVNKNHSNTPSHQAERLKELVKSKL